MASIGVATQAGTLTTPGGSLVTSLVARSFTTTFMTFIGP